ncbi:MAG TPA: DNA mismatch repair protein MutS [Desulfitobacteriaceae bacterium]|nr:DNA mismatch repair protein MutS [Desulfitobacteriaceae bacterium]
MTTPMMQQYRATKAKVPDAILFFRLGDFYEMFDQDAVLAAPILEIALTARDSGGGKKIPMCGIPHHAVNNYLGKLVNSGYKVAICEQVEDPRQTKGIVKREIIRIVSPGTFTDPALTEINNNFLGSVYHEGAWGLAFLDVSTGEFTIFETPRFEVLLTELTRIKPAELLLPPDLNNNKFFQNYFLTTRPRPTFAQNPDFLKRFPKQTILLADLPAAAKAAGALWSYFMETMPSLNPSHIVEIKSYGQDQWMILDQWTRRNLELTETIRSQGKKGTLLDVLDLTKTAFGGRLLKRWVEQPLIVASEINLRLDITDNLVNDSFLRKDLAKLLTGIYDLERLMGKVSYGSVHAKDLLALAQTLSTLPKITSALTGSQTRGLQDYVHALAGFQDLTDLLFKALNPEAPLTLREGNLIKSGFSPEIDELRSLAFGGKEWLALLEASERERTGIRSLKIGFNKVFGYYIEITHTNAHLVPENYLRKQTLANAERFITPELKEYENKILAAEEKLIDLEYQQFLELRETVRSFTEKILQAAHALAEIDVFTGLAEIAVRNHYVRPALTEDGELKIIEGRHPVIEQMPNQENFIPNDTLLTAKKHLAIITGPNMAGKSTYMRQVALIVLMAHIGSYVPAQSAVIPVVDRIFTRVGASDDLAAGQSTFMVEMREVAHILNNATRNSLIIFDEVGRGTATFDGLSIAWSVVEYLVQTPDLKAKTLFATHYHELTTLEENFPEVFNLHVGVREHADDIIFLHKILPGRADRSYGIQVARLAGLPAGLLNRAKTLLQEFETDYVNFSSFKPADTVTQIRFFEEPEIHPLLREIECLDPEEMSPRQALQYLFDLKNRLVSSKTI